MSDYSGNTIDDLDSSTPTGFESVSAVDDAIRQIKRFIKSPLGLLQLAYPVGHIYVSTVDNDPATTLGFGSWTKLEEVMLVAHKEFSDEFGVVTANKTTPDGGEKTHTLTESEIPSHSHTFQLGDNNDDEVGPPAASNGSIKVEEFTTNETGGGEPHNNLPPYRTVYMWERVL